jgi:hypothetical protein
VHHQTGYSTQDMMGAIGLLFVAVAMWAGVLLVFLKGRRGSARAVWAGGGTLVALGVAVQLGHLSEHTAQLGYWAGHRNSPAWMTPWANGLARGFGRVDPSKPTLGMEILHFIGNMAFLAGLVGLLMLTRRSPQLKARKWARMGVWMQGLHGLEHLSLMVSVWAGAPRAIGVSTGFGLVDPGPGLWTYRIWWHFVANVIGSVVFGVGVWHFWRERQAVRLDLLRSADGTPAPRGHRSPSRRRTFAPSGAV